MSLLPHMGLFVFLSHRSRGHPLLLLPDPPVLPAKRKKKNPQASSLSEAEFPHCGP